MSTSVSTEFGSWLTAKKRRPLKALVRAPGLAGRYSGTTGRRAGFVEDALVIGFVGGDDVVGAEVFLGMDASGFAHFAATVGAGQDFNGVAGGFLHITWLHQKSIHTMLDDFRDAADIGGDDGNFAGHGFEGGEAEGFELGREKEEIATAEHFLDDTL